LLAADIALDLRDYHINVHNRGLPIGAVRGTASAVGLGHALARTEAARSSSFHEGGTLLDVMRVLVVEDEPKMAALLHRGLEERGTVADVVSRGEDAVWMAASTPFDVVILDVMLPGIDGFETCRRLRAQGVWTPVLILTARDAVEDRVAGLDGGADDYLTKPFSFAELMARLRVLARRAVGERPPALERGDLRLDPVRREVTRRGEPIELSAKEFLLLETFMRNPGDVLSRLRLLESAWGYEYEHRSNVVDVYIRHLREKIDRPFGTDSIETIRGVGYRFRETGGS